MRPCSDLVVVFFPSICLWFSSGKDRTQYCMIIPATAVIICEEFIIPRQRREHFFSSRLCSLFICRSVWVSKTYCYKTYYKMCHASGTREGKKTCVNEYTVDCSFPTQRKLWSASETFDLLFVYFIKVHVLPLPLVSHQLFLRVTNDGPGPRAGTLPTPGFWHCFIIRHACLQNAGSAEQNNYTNQFSLLLISLI